LDRAAELLDRIRGDLESVAQDSSEWVHDLDTIAAAATATARAGKRVAEGARANAQLAARMGEALARAQQGAQSSSQETQAVAAAASEQLRAIEDLAQVPPNCPASPTSSPARSCSSGGQRRH
jgi:uncharacterized membrane protein YdfJ with MMPL/SSD domain